jgi:polysaccharide biosynthesis/export protein VpsN
MKNTICLGALLVCGLLSGCGGGGSHSASPSTASVAVASPTSDVIRAGDKVTIRLSGVPDDGYFNELQIPQSGDITVPLLTQSFHAVGRTPHELADDIADAYKAQKIYSNPVVTVLPEDRFVNVGGEVRSPTRVIFAADLTVMSAINSCGGFTEYADKRHVRVLRGQQLFQVDCVAAVRNPGADPQVLPGDQIDVPRTMF